MKTYAELTTAQKKQLGRILMANIVSLLDESDFGFVQTPNPLGKSKPLPHLGISSDVLLDKFYVKINGTQTYEVLSKYPELIIANNGLLTLQQAQDKYYAMQYLKEKKNGKK